jgi:hypothetical protein
VDSHVGTPFFVGHIYIVFSPRSNEWGTDYCRVHFLEGKHTLMRSIIDFKGNEFLKEPMVIKGEYLTRDGRTKKKGGYIFQDYRLGETIYHFKNLVVVTNLQLQTMPRNNSSKVRYFLS